MTEEERVEEEEVPSVTDIRVQITKLAEDLQQATEHFDILSNLWKQRDEMKAEVKAKDKEIQSFQKRIKELEEQQALSVLGPSEGRPMGEDEFTQLKRLLENLSITLTKVFVNARSSPNLPDKLMQSIDETEAILMGEGLPEMRVLVTLGRLGGISSSSTLQMETSLTQEEVNKALEALHASGAVIEEPLGTIQLTSMKTMEPTISQWKNITSVAEIFKQCQRFTESTIDPNDIASALEVMRDVLFTKGVSGVVVAEIAKEARKWRTGAGDREDLMELLREWEQRSLT